MRARFLLDTDICIYVLKRRSDAVLARFDRLKSGEAVISIVAFGELTFGARKSKSPDASRAYLEALTTVAAVEALPVEAAEYYAEIRHALESKGTPIGGNDLWIAAHAKAARLTLVTNNEREFRRVPGLRIQNWAE
jgi:tRNA(fMet)-specific endonuclease VapC